MMVPEILALVPIKLPTDAWRDHKKLTKYLTDVEKTVNKALVGM